MNKIIKKEYFVIEVEREFDISDNDLEIISEMSDEEKQEYIEEKLCSYRYWGENDCGDDKLKIKEMEIPEYSEYLGYIDIIKNDDIDYDIILGSTINSDGVLLNGDTLETFYWDYSGVDRMDIKQYIRDIKLKDILD